jgi:hypothetical protein
MSGLCGTCKHTVYCTFRAGGGAKSCDEFEDVSLAEEHDWDLQSLLKLYPGEESESGQQAETQ